MISGGDLPHPITLPFEDDFALWALPTIQTAWDLFPSWPTALDVAPQAPGTGYDIWSDVEGFGFIAPDISGEKVASTYYPAVGAVMLRTPSTEQWIKLDGERDSMLRRYVELGRAGLLPEEPSILDVFAAERVFTGALTPVEVDGRPLSGEQLAAFWDVVASQQWPEVLVTITPAGAKRWYDNDSALPERATALALGYPDGARIVIDAPDGRRLELRYYPETSMIAGLPVNWAYAPSGRGFEVPLATADSFAAALGVSRPTATNPVSAGSDAVSAKESTSVQTAAAAVVVALGIAAALATAVALGRSASRGIRA